MWNAAWDSEQCGGPPGRAYRSWRSIASGTIVGATKAANPTRSCDPAQCLTGTRKRVCRLRDALWIRYLEKRWQFRSEYSNVPSYQSHSAPILKGKKGSCTSARGKAYPEQAPSF